MASDQLLLDTCTFLWLATDHSKLSARAKERIARSAGGIFISTISAFEIALKHGKGRLVLPMEPEAWIEEALAFHGIAELPVDWRIAARSAALPLAHGDPCDRIILATAGMMELVLLTPDPILRAFPGVTADW